MISSSFVQNVNALTTIPTDVSEASDGCELMGIEGSYIVDTENALKRINEIRYEACKEGVINPDNTDEKLTLADYVPIKWSSDLEYIARIRAAESSITRAHLRTNGESWINMKSLNSVRSYGEVIAWNSSESVIQGINQWYAEKSYWVNQNFNKVSGHYTQMISPSHKYIGLGTFCSENTRYYNTTVGEYSSKNNLDETRGSGINNCVQLIEVNNEYINNTLNISGNTNINAKSSTSLKSTISVSLKNNEGILITTYNIISYNPLTWSSSNPSVASVDENGKVTGIHCGNSVISVVDNKRSGSVNVTVNHNYVQTITKATTSKNGSIVYKCSMCGDVKSNTTIYHPKTVSISNVIYTGKQLKPKVTVKDSKGKTISSKNYTLKYTNNKNVGQATVKITFKGNYSGTLTKKFTISPKATSLSKLTGSKKSIVLKWKKQSSQTTGYQIQYSTNSKFSKSNKTITVSKNSTVNTTIKNLKAKKKYYVRIRTYKNVNGKNYYSKWSNAKSVTTKK
jgi:hypothetical protein